LALALPSNSKTQLERVTKGKPSSLLGLVVSDEGKNVYNIDTWLVFSEFWYLLCVIMLCRTFFSGWSNTMYNFGVNRQTIVTVADKLKKYTMMDFEEVL
jgi:hypothetical protein